MTLLEDQLDRLRVDIRAGHLFPHPPVIHFSPEEQLCSVCSHPLRVQKTRLGKRGATLAIGEFQVHETVRHCPACGQVVHARELRTLIPEGANFGYDVIVHIGRMLFLQARGYPAIQQDLRERNIFISTSEIGVLAKRFVLLMGILHRSLSNKLNDYLQFNGGYILHLDGTCDGASPHLVSVLDGITEIVLENVKLVSENSEDLIVFLNLVCSRYGKPLAIVSDMGTGIATAVSEVFPTVPAFICHFHFLKAVGKELMGGEQEILRSRLRKSNVRPALRAVKKRLEKQIALKDPYVASGLIQGRTSDELAQQASLESLPFLAAYLLVVWIMDAPSTCDGYGFPFDQPYLALYQRIQEAYHSIQELVPVHLRGDWKDNTCYGWVTCSLRGVITDASLATTAKRLEAKAEVFTQLRQAMRITLPEQKRGLTDEGDVSVNMKTIAKEVNQFCTRLARRYPKNQEYRKLIDTIQTRGSQLFADPLAVDSAAGTILIQPQRTNNLLETFFRKLKRTYCKRNGFSSMEKILKTMLPDTPLTMNLNNGHYMELLLEDGQTLEQKFAQIDMQEIRRLAKETAVTSCAAFPHLKKIIRLPDLPLSIVTALKKLAS